ncbi:hypothetical protein GF373_08575 [bacterium]|nr:hypothetical protein [bacterium]
MPEINVLPKSPPRPRNNAKARKEYKKNAPDFLEEHKAEIDAVKEEIEAQREEIMEQARKIKAKAKYGGKIEKELDIESKRAKEIAEQVRESMSQAMKLAEQFMPEEAEWKEQMPSREELQKMMPSEEEIKQFLPKEKDMKAIQEMLKGFQIPFLGGMRGEETHERTHMIFKVTFNKLHFLKDNPEKFREEVDIDVY